MDEILAVLSRTTDGVYAVDRDQRIIFWNTAAERMLGYPADEIIGRPCHEIFHGEPRPGCLHCQPNCPVMRAASRHELVPTYNLLSRTREGRPILLNVSVIIPLDGTSPYATIHLFRDATHQLQYETYVDQILCAAARLPNPQTTLAQQRPYAQSVYAPLSPREKEVLNLLVQGQAAQKIAQTLCISYATVRNHLQKILHKLGVHSQREAVKLAMEHRLV
jgi:PAS domain S-box-containing protein